MGQQTETLFGVVASFVEKRSWTQAEPAQLQTEPETIRKQLGEFQGGGFKFERCEDHPHVYWSVPKNWFQEMLPFKADEVPELLRPLGRAPRRAPLAGFRHEGLVVERVFFVRDPEAAWVEGNLPDDRIAHEAVAVGARFRIATTGAQMLARFVTGLGVAATAKTPELAAVEKLARGALANATKASS